MNTTSRGICACLFVVALVGLSGCWSAAPYRETVSGPRGEFVKEDLAVELRAARDGSADPRATAESVLARLGAESDAGLLLSEALAGSGGADGAQRLDEGLERAIEALEFGTVVEAELPADWPEPSPEGLVRVKSYPRTRLARVDGEEDDGMFMALFRHIRDRDIPMTAPVEMEWSGEGASAMAFLYRHGEVGTPGRDGVVEVRDAEPLTVVSVGRRGGYYESCFDREVERLQEWIAANGEWVAAGPPRVLAYNSPFVPWFRKYAEVQIPVARR